MELSLREDELKNYVRRQLENFFPDKYKFFGSDIDKALNLALYRLENCFKYINDPFYYSCAQKKTYFHHLHGDQYASFLYFLANSLWTLAENKPICDKLIYLNRTLNNFFISYKCKMPDIFFLCHPQGTIIGNADYEDFLAIFQDVTIASPVKDSKRNWKVSLGRGVLLATGAKIIGSTTIGNYASIGANVVIHHKNIPAKSIAYHDDDGKLVIRQKNSCVAQRLFNVNIEA